MTEVQFLQTIISLKKESNTNSLIIFPLVVIFENKMKAKQNYLYTSLVADVNLSLKTIHDVTDRSPIDYDLPKKTISAYQITTNNYNITSAVLHRNSGVTNSNCNQRHIKGIKHTESQWQRQRCH